MNTPFLQENDVAFKKKQQEDAKKMAEMKAAAGKKGPMSKLSLKEWGYKDTWNSKREYLNTCTIRK